MRNINVFYQEVKDGKYTETQFLNEVQKDSRFPFIKPSLSFENVVQTFKNRGIIHQPAQVDNRHFDLNKFLLESKANRTIHRDYAHPYEYRIGMELELQECGGDVVKAEGIVLKNLTSNPNYYTQKNMGVLNEKDPNTSIITEAEELALELSNFIPTQPTQETSGPTGDVSADASGKVVTINGKSGTIKSVGNLGNTPAIFINWEKKFLSGGGTGVVTYDQTDDSFSLRAKASDAPINLRTSRVDPYFSQVLAALAKRFNPASQITPKSFSGGIQEAPVQTTITQARLQEILKTSKTVKQLREALLEIGMQPTMLQQEPQQVDQRIISTNQQFLGRPLMGGQVSRIMRSHQAPGKILNIVAPPWYIEFNAEKDDATFQHGEEGMFRQQEKQVSAQDAQTISDIINSIVPQSKITKHSFNIVNGGEQR